MEKTKTIEITAGDIVYCLTRKRVKNISLRIKADGSVYVTADGRIPQNVIDGFVLSKRLWIKKHQADAEKNKSLPAVPSGIFNGAKVFFLGEEKQVEITAGKKSGVAIIDGKIVITAKESASAEKYFSRWLKKETERTLSGTFEGIKQNYKHIFGEDFTLKLRKMKSRWGSYNHKKRQVTLNTCLIFAPLYCIEYVSLHELCHSFHQNHSKQFYALLDKFMPEWKTARKYLRQNGSRFLSF